MLSKSTRTIPNMNRSKPGLMFVFFNMYCKCHLCLKSTGGFRQNCSRHHKNRQKSDEWFAGLKMAHKHCPRADRHFVKPSLSTKEDFYYVCIRGPPTDRAINVQHVWLRVPQMGVCFRPGRAQLWRAPGEPVWTDGSQLQGPAPVLFNNGTHALSQGSFTGILEVSNFKFNSGLRAICQFY